jgi:hypothetical protein
MCTKRAERGGDQNFNRISVLFNPDDLYRAKIHSIPSAIVQIRRRTALSNIPIEPEFLNYLAERIIRILFEKARAGVPAGSATDAGRTINDYFHDISPPRAC